MRFFSKLRAFLANLFTTDAESAPYPLCQDEWDFILEEQHKEELLQTCQRLVQQAAKEAAR